MVDMNRREMVAGCLALPVVGRYITFPEVKHNSIMVQIYTKYLKDNRWDIFGRLIAVWQSNAYKQGCELTLQHICDLLEGKSLDKAFSDYHNHESVMFTANFENGKLAFIEISGV